MKVSSLNMFLLVGVCLALLNPSGAYGQFTFPERPGLRDFVADYANILSAEQATYIRHVCDRVLTETATPIIVVTLLHLTDYAPSEVTLEAYAQALFNHWGIGHAQVQGQPWDTGILLLWVHDMGRVRVELGKGWGHTQDAAVKQMLLDDLRPRRAAGDVAGGIVATVEALAEMARQRPWPRPPSSQAETETNGLALGVIALGGVGACLTWMIVVLWRRGRATTSGQRARPTRATTSDEWWSSSDTDATDDSGGGFDSGSFGGGSSDGGGASE